VIPLYVRWRTIQAQHAPQLEVHHQACPVSSPSDTMVSPILPALQTLLASLGAPLPPTVMVHTNKVRANMACVPPPPGAEAVIAECIPGTTWTKECNTCICSSTGQATCTTNSCRSSTCTPGTTWSADCNTCVCNSSGEPVCTKIVCQERCVVEAGPDKGAECVFPFSWGGKTYSGCTPWTYGGTFQGRGWCSTKTNEEGLHVNGEGNYGFCSSDCPLATDSDIRDRFTRIRDEDDAIVFQEPNNLAPQ